jgi:hypothetical protein
MDSAKTAAADLTLNEGNQSGRISNVTKGAEPLLNINLWTQFSYFPIFFGHLRFWMAFG